MPPLSPATDALGKRIKEQRALLGISQETLADRSGLHWTFVGQVERGQRNLRFHNLLKLAAGLDMDAGKLVQGIQPPAETAPVAKASKRRSR